MANKVLFSNLGKSPKDKIINIIIILVIAVILFFGIRFIVRKIKELNTDAAKELRAATAAGVKLTFKESEYANFAETLYRAMKGFGTDEDAIFNVFYQMQNIADVLKLVTAYGSKNGEDLNAWLKGDLSTSEINKLNSILATKGIDYKF